MKAKATVLATLRLDRALCTSVRNSLFGILAVSTLVLSGCSLTLEKMPLPGGANVGSDPNTVQIAFENVLDLVPQSVVKSGGVVIGTVSEVGLSEDGWNAAVTVELNSEAEIPSDAIAAVQQTNLLGEKFIELRPPTLADGESHTELLTDGARIPLERTVTTTDIEQVLGALSLLLNGGGLSHLEPIIRELTTAMDGREDTFKSLLTQSEALISSLNRQRDTIAASIDSLSVMAERTANQTEQIAGILDELPQGIAVLEEQRPAFVEMLTKVNQLGDVGTEILEESKDDLIHNLRALRPILQELAKAGPDVIKSLESVPTYPFPDSAFSGDGSNSGMVGNSSNLFLSLDLQIASVLRNTGVGLGDPVYQEPHTSRPVYVDSSNPYINGNGPREGDILRTPALPFRIGGRSGVSNELAGDGANDPLGGYLPPGVTEAFPDKVVDGINDSIQGNGLVPGGNGAGSDTDNTDDGGGN